MKTLTTEDFLMDRKQVTDYLHICRTTLDRLNLPKIKIRRKVLFSKAAIDQWLREHTTNDGGVS